MAEGGDVFDKFENNHPENVEEDSGDQLESESNDLLNQVEDPYAETAWIDDDTDYEGKDITTVRRIGIKSNIRGYINHMITDKGTFRKGMADYKRMSTVKLIRSFLSVSEGLITRPLLNNEPGLEIIQGVSFGRGGGVNSGGNTLILNYRGVDVRMINTSRNDDSGNPITEKLNVGSEKEVEFTKLVADVIVATSDVVESVADKTGVSLEVVTDVTDKDEYLELTPEMIESMVMEKSKHYKPKPGEKIDRLIKDLNDTTIFDGVGNDPVSLPEIPESVTRDIAESSVSEISRRLHGRVEELTEQEIREFAGILNPRGDADIRIGVLDQMANEYRQYALREAEPLKEQLYKNIQGVAELKSDFIRVTEKGDPPIHSEARAVFEEEVDGNESIEDLSRLERFKEWMKENWLNATSFAVAVASLLTTVILGTRTVIKKGANAVGSFGRSVYNTFKKLAKRLGPVLGPIIIAVGNLIVALIKYGAMGLAWLASNLWVLVLAIVWMVYDRYGK